MNRRALLILLVLSALPASAASRVEDLICESQAKGLAESPEWLRLLHYRDGVLGGRKSGIDGPGFFLSPQGRRDPQAELDATLAAFAEPVDVSTDAEHPQCRFPARYQFLSSRLDFEGAIERRECPRLDAWKEKLNPESVSMVFASYYMNNPASMYGHTFLRLNRGGKTRGNALLDYTVNFAAATDETNGILFAVMGLAGGYRGLFSTTPYYMKVQKYNNLEARDLWEYELNVSTAGIERLVNHLWELGHTSMAYYFFNRNCSYQLLPLLEVAEPSWNVSEPFAFRAIPLDTLRSVIDQPGVVREVVLRPSHLRQLRARRMLLSESEARAAQRFVNGRSADAAALAALPPERRASVLDAAYDYLKFRTGFKRGQPQLVQDKERTLLLLRSESGPSSPSAPTGRGEARPDAGHRTARVGVGAGATKRTEFEEVTIRAAIHDLEARQTGYVPGSQLQMFNIRARFDNERGRAHLEEFTLIDIKSLAAWEPWIRPPSWRLRAGFATPRDLNRRDERSNIFGVGGGSGVTLRLPGIPGGAMYGLIEGQADTGGSFRDGYRLGLGGTSGVLFDLGRAGRTHVSAGWMRFGAGHISSANVLRAVQTFFLTTSLEARVTLERQNGYREGVVSLNLYY